MKKRRKVNLLVILSVFICLVFVTLNSVKFKFLLEVIKLSNTLPTISTDFYNGPINPMFSISKLYLSLFLYTHLIVSLTSEICLSNIISSFINS